jgi:predicted nuclease with TOPRIM domain
MKFVEYIKNNKVISVVLGLSLLFNIYTLNENSLLSDDYTNVATDYNELLEEYNGLLEENQKLEKDKKELQDKVEQAKPWFEMKEEERKAKQERLEKEKKEKQEQERLEKEKKEKQGYNTGITYNQLARTPDEYEGEKVKFSGKVLQVSEGFGYNVIRLGVNGSYDNVLYLIVFNGTTEERILEDDYITIYGVSKGIETYTTVMGASMSIPKVNVDKIDM